MLDDEFPRQQSRQRRFGIVTQRGDIRKVCDENIYVLGLPSKKTTANRQRRRIRLRKNRSTRYTKCKSWKPAISMTCKVARPPFEPPRSSIGSLKIDWMAASPSRRKNSWSA